MSPTRDEQRQAVLGNLATHGQGARCRCRNLADEYMPPSERIGDTEAKRRGLWSTSGCPTHAAPRLEAAT